VIDAVSFLNRASRWIPLRNSAWLEVGVPSSSGQLSVTTQVVMATRALLGHLMGFLLNIVVSFSSLI
jgi:hypothetical protein